MNSAMGMGATWNGYARSPRTVALGIWALTLGFVSLAASVAAIVDFNRALPARPHTGALGR